MSKLIQDLIQVMVEVAILEEVVGHLAVAQVAEVVGQVVIMIIIVEDQIITQEEFIMEPEQGLQHANQMIAKKWLNGWP